MSISVKFGGLDVAVRVDNTAFICLELKDSVFEEIGQKVWPHIEPAEIGEDLLLIQRKERMNAVGYDRLGSGEFVKMFSREIPLVPIVSSMSKKQDIIGLIRGLNSAKRLIIHTDSLYKEMYEQETYKSEAGNVLYRHPSGFHDDRFWALGYACDVATKYLMGMPTPMAVTFPKPRDIDEELEVLLKHI